MDKLREQIINDTVRGLVQQLIPRISGFDAKSEHFETIEDFAYSHLASSDYINIYNRRDIERTVDGLCEKYQFHGFNSQANVLKMHLKRLFDSAEGEEDLKMRISIVKFLLNISKSPTRQFVENPELLKLKIVVEEEKITDWKEVLIDDTKFPIVSHFSDSDDDDQLSDISTVSVGALNLPEVSNEVDIIKALPENKIVIPTFDFKTEAKNALLELRNTIQNSWWNARNVKMSPDSQHTEATVCLNWDKFVHSTTYGLVEPNTNIISEYKIMRELIWQFFAPNSCVSFKYKNGKITPNSNISISSIRSHTLELFLQEFIPYFEIFKTFRDFQKSLEVEYFVASIPDTYRSYSCAISEILQPAMKKIGELENRIQKQNDTMTILSLAHELRPVCGDIELLYTIHKELIKAYTVDDSCKSTTFLLSRLYYGLLNSSDVKEQNLYLTLYLKSLYKYFITIEIWLKQDKINDVTDEFIIYDLNSKNNEPNSSYNTQICSTKSIDLSTTYVARELDEFSKMDGMLNIIATKILQLGKNIHLLRLLGKMHLINKDLGKKTLHKEFTDAVLNEAEIYLNLENRDELEEIIDNDEEPEKKFSIICPEQKMSATGMDKIENFVDLSNGFLTTVFEPYLYQNVEETKSEEYLLYETINKRINAIVPVKRILEKTFIEVVDKHYCIPGSTPGLLVKDIILKNYNLKRYLNLIQHLYLFKDDLIFPFYRKMFEKLETHQVWGNFFWLTSQLQDLLMDLYPEHYENIRVDVDTNWKSCNNPIRACEMISIHCKITWPVSIVLRVEDIEKYQKMFQFILKLKWALNTLNHLKFSDIEPKTKPLKLHPLLIQERIKKLQTLRFYLLDQISSIQHYVLGHLFNRLGNAFDQDLDQSWDIDSLIKAHKLYITRINLFCLKMNDSQSDLWGFGLVLSLVTELHSMWHNLYRLDDRNLTNCELNYRKCYIYLKPFTEIDVPGIEN